MSTFIFEVITASASWRLPHQLAVDCAPSAVEAWGKMLLVDHSAQG